MVDKITALLNKKIKEGLYVELDYIFDDFINLLSSVNDGFDIDIDIVLNYNSCPIYYLVLSISYEDDNKIEYIFNYIEDDRRLIITSMEQINFN